LKKSETVERREERQRDAAEAMAEYRNNEEAIAAKMARLRALRLSREADAPQAAPTPKPSLAKSKPVAASARRSTARNGTQPKTNGLVEKILAAKEKASGAEAPAKRKRAKKAS
jgi:hypothetical protein